MKPLIRLFLLIGLAGWFYPGGVLAEGVLWRDVERATAEQISAGADLPRHYRLLRLDITAFEQQMAAVSDPGAGSAQSGRIVIELPLPEGGTRAFSVKPDPVMAPELAAKYPTIQTSSGVAVDDPQTSLRMDWTPLGLHAMVMSPGGVFYIDPVNRDDRSLYLCFYRKDARRLPRTVIEPDFMDRPDLRGAVTSLPSEEQVLAIGDKLRTYRLAVATTTGYTQYFGGTQEKGLAAVVTAVSRINLIYQQELAIRFQLVADNDRIIFVDSDPYGKLLGSPLLVKNQEVIDREIGASNYDVGHIFLDVPAGLAYVRSVCEAGYKAGGQTGANKPERDAFWVDYVAHEIGHQVGADHTFNTPEGDCGKQRQPTSAFESGSGITIMGYAGLCGNDDIAENSIPHFHVRSFEQITANVRSGDGSLCGTDTPTGNSPPAVDAGPGGQTIPIQTPFFLAGSGSDPDGHALTYSWEQYDLGQPATLAQTKYQLPELGTIPLFRSFSPQAARGRYFPRLASILRDRNGDKEVLPGYSREMKFRLMARDGLGGVASSAVRSIFATAEAGPFVIKKPGKHALWKGNELGRVTWDVANTDQAPVGCGTVNVTLSIDGGKSFPILLIRDTPNSGQVDVPVPSLATETARVLVACGGLFGDISDGDFTITP